MAFAWLDFRSEAQRKKDEAAYEQTMFPYGKPQRTHIEALLEQLVPKETAQMRMLYYLQARGAYLEEDEATPAQCMQKAVRALQGLMRGKERVDIPLYCALMQADVEITPELAYPDAQTLRERAQQLPMGK